MASTAPNGCKKAYSRADFHAAAAKSFRRVPYSHHERTTLRRVLKCQVAATASSRHRTKSNLRMHLRRFKVAYDRRFYWEIRWYDVPWGLKATLNRVHNCESADYYLDGHHDGGYQYDTRTWWEAQNWQHTPARRRTKYAFQASARQQDVVTAAFFPSNQGRWTASVHCWG